MVRPTQPVSIQAVAYVWVAGRELLNTAKDMDLVEEAARCLASGHMAFTMGELVVSMSGVMFGQSVGGEIQVPNLDVRGRGFPIVTMLGVAVEGRVPGLPCEIGLFSETARNRRWMVSFGDVSLEEWRRVFNTPEFLRISQGGLVFTTRNNAGTVRRELWEVRRQADQKWKN